jgi:TRAP transporter TAXI family solute receptor
MKPAIVSALAFLLGLACLPAQAEKQRYINIGTGGLTGVYYPTGGAICRLLNKGRRDHGIRCAVESTGGSVFNLNALAAGDLDFGIVQSDWQYHALNGSAEFEGKANPELRSVFALHAEAFTLVARADAGVKEFADLKGKRVNRGNPGSGHRGTFEEVMKAAGWSENDFALLAELKASEMAPALCDNKIDAFVYTVGHPNGALEEVTTTCNARLVPFAGSLAESMLAAHPYYSRLEIPAGLYRDNPAPTPTLGVKATLVTHSQVPEDVVYRLVKAVFDNFDEFKNLHPAFASLQIQEMLQGNSAPLHPGAEKYYQERGWVKSDE